jgi:hypothetical protein
MAASTHAATVFLSSCMATSQRQHRSIWSRLTDDARDLGGPHFQSGTRFIFELMALIHADDTGPTS